MANARIVNTPAQALTQDGTTHRDIYLGNSPTVLDIDDIQLEANGGPISNGTTHILFQISGGAANATFDGVTDPTVSSGGKGFKYLDNTSAYMSIDMFRKIKIISQGASTVRMQVQELNFR